jgi:hypothetical protein
MENKWKPVVDLEAVAREKEKQKTPIFPAMTQAARQAVKDVKDTYKNEGIWPAVGEAARGAAATLVGRGVDVINSHARTVQGPARALEKAVTGEVKTPERNYASPELGGEVIPAAPSMVKGSSPEPPKPESSAPFGVGPAYTFSPAVFEDGPADASSPTPFEGSLADASSPTLFEDGPAYTFSPAVFEDGPPDAPFEGGPAAAFSRTIKGGTVRYEDGQGNYLEGPASAKTGQGGLSIMGDYAGPTSTTGMTPEQRDAFEANRQQRSAANVARMTADTEALRDLRRVRTNIFDWRPPDWKRSPNVQVFGDTSPQEALKDYAAGRVGSDGYGMISNLMKKINATDKKGNPTEASKAAAGVLEGFINNQQESSTPELGDLISLANMQQSAQQNELNNQFKVTNMQQSAQQNELNNQFRVDKRNREVAAEQHRQNREVAAEQRDIQNSQLKRFGERTEAMLPGIQRDFPWLGEDAIPFLHDAAEIDPTDPNKAMEMLSGVQTMWTNSDEPAFTIQGREVTGREAVELLNGNNPFSGWPGPGSDFVEAARRQAQRAAQEAALRELGQ